MAQFDVHPIAGHGLVVDMQHDFMSALRSRVVAPLRPLDEPTVIAGRLNPEVTVGDDRYRVALHLLRAVEISQLERSVASLAEQKFEIKAALDLLTGGF